MNKKLYELINKYTDNSLLLVTSSNIKKIILEEYKQGLRDISFITINELLDKLLWIPSDKCIYALMNHFGFVYDVAQMYLQNIKVLLLEKSKTCSNYKLSKLREVYEYLDKQNLLIHDKLFKEYLKHKKVIFLGVKVENELKEYFKDIDYEVFTITDKKDLSNIIVKEFDDYENEITYVLENICRLIQENVPLDKIKVIGISEDNYFETKMIFDLYDIPLQVSLNESLQSYRITNDVINLVFSNDEDIMTHLADYENSLTEDEKEIYQYLINIINEFPKEELLINKENILTKIRNTTLVVNSHQENTKTITMININDAWIYSDCYLFIIGLNQGLIPTIYKDEDYLDDLVKEELGIKTSIMKNKDSYEYLEVLLQTNNMFFLSFRHHGSEGILYPSELIKRLGLKTIRPQISYSNYSDKYNKYIETKYLDRFIKYGDKKTGLEDLLATYDIKYRNYDNSFKGISKGLLKELINNKIKLSYSRMNTLYNCPFSFLIKYVLKLDQFEDSFFTFIGNLFHDILSRAFLEDANFDFNYQFEEFLTKATYKTNDKENLLLNKLKNELQEIIKTIETHNSYLNYKNALYEENITVFDTLKYQNEEYETIFDGKIDKILYIEIDNKPAYTVVIDYKTGSTDIDLSLFYHGLSLQLPVYLYLISKHPILKDTQIFGFYLQRILHNEIKADNEEEYENTKEKELRIVGYSLDHFPADACFDSTYADSKVIKGMKLKKRW